MSSEYTTEDLVRKLKRDGYTLVGSRRYFSGMPGFNPSDYDFVKVVPKNNKFEILHHSHILGVCINQIVKRNFNEVFSYFEANKENSLTLNLCCFFIPKIAKEFNFDFKNNHQLLEPFLERLSNRHKYYQVIYDSYVENNGCFLTDEQRKKAYQVYLQARTKTQ